MSHTTKTKDELLEKLKLKYKELDRVPKKEEMRNPDYTEYEKQFGNWKVALLLAGISSGSSKLYTEPYRSNLLKKLVKEYQEQNHSLQVPEIEDIVPHKVETLYKAFDCKNIKEFNNMLKDLLDTGYLEEPIEIKAINDNNENKDKVDNLNEATKETFNKDDVIEEIINYSINNSPAIATEEIKNIPNIPSYHGIQTMFHMTWGNLLRKLDLKMKQSDKFNKIDNDKSLWLLRQDINNHKLHTLSHYSLHKPTNSFSAVYYFKRFNVHSWKDLVKIASMSNINTDEPKVVIRGRIYTKQIIVDTIKQKAKELGKTPTKEDISKDIPKRAYVRLFGAWTNALLESGFEPHIANKFVKYTDDEVSDILKKLQSRLKEKGSAISNYDIEMLTSHSAGFVCKLFEVNNIDELNSLLRNKDQSSSNIQDIKMKFDNSLLFRQKYSKEELIGTLKEKAKELGRCPTVLDIEEDTIRRNVYVRIFGSWKNALKEAGFSDEIADLRRSGVSAKLSEEEKQEILVKLRNKYQQLQRPLNTGDVRTATKKNNETIYNVFGLFSIRELNELLEFTFPELQKIDPTNYYAQIIKDNYNGNIDDLREDIGEDLFKNIELHFTNWNNALKYAGFDYLTKKYSDFTDEDKSEIIEKIIKYTLDIGKSPQSKEIQNIDGITDAKTLEIVFNTRWGAFRQMLDLSMTRYKTASISNRQMLIMLRKDIKNNNLQSLFEYSTNKPEDSLPAIYYYKRFNISNWDKFVDDILMYRNVYKQAVKHIPREKQRSNTKKEYTKKDLIKVIQDKESDKIIDQIIRYTLKNGNILNEDNINDLLNNVNIQELFHTNFESLRFYFDLNTIRQQEFDSLNNKILIAKLKDTVSRYDLKDLTSYSMKRPIDSFAAIYYYKKFYIQDWDKFIELILNE